MKKVAIIGAGIVGSTAAYYLSKNSIFQVTIFDHGIGQATRQQLVLSAHGFPNGVIKRGIVWHDWEQIFIWI